MSGLIWKEWRQSGWIVIATLVLFGAMIWLNSTGLVTQYKDNKQYYQSAEFIKDNQVDKESHMSPKEIEESLHVNIDSFATWSIFFSFIFLFIGLKVTVFEKNKHMDYFTFGIPFSKTRIFLVKHLTILVPLILGVILFMGLGLINIYSQIPSQYLPNFGSLIIRLFWVTAFYLFVWEIGIVVGVVVGEIITACIVAVGFFISAMVFFASGLNNIILNIRSFVTGKNFEESGFFWQKWSYEEVNSDKFYLLMALLLFVIALLLFVGGFLLFKRISLENNGKFLMFPRLRPWVIGVAMIYVPIALGSLYADVSYNAAGDPTITTLGDLIKIAIWFVVIATTVGVIFWLLMYKWNVIRKTRK